MYYGSLILEVDRVARISNVEREQSSRVLGMLFSGTLNRRYYIK